MEFVHCADVIAKYQGRYVVVERLLDGAKLALPGGKQDRYENGVKERLSNTALRELKEETGLDGDIQGVLGVYADDGRDPRGQFLSCVFIIDTYGTLRKEIGKSNPIVLTRDHIVARRRDFMFDHADIYHDYFLSL